MNKKNRGHGEEDREKKTKTEKRRNSEARSRRIERRANLQHKAASRNP